MNCKYGFKEARKGYDPQEVDAYIDEQLARMTAMQKQNEILMRKLQKAEDKLSTLSEKEQSLRNSIAESKRGAAAMLSDARTRSNTLIDSARQECNKIVDELDAEIESRYKTIEDMRGAVSAFKSELFRLYSDHIENIEALAAAAEGFTYEPDFTALSEAIDEFEESGDVAPAQIPDFPEITEETVAAELEMDDEDIEEPELSQLEFGFDEPEETEFEPDASEEETLLFYDPAETTQLPEDEPVFAAEKPEREEKEPEAMNEDDELFSFPEEETSDGEELDFVTEEEMFAFLDETDEDKAEAEETEQEEIFAFPEEEAEVDPDDDMFITDKDEHKDKEDLFNFLKDFVNGTEE